jgi:L-amino acid N-acyltransferase YncA
MGYLALQRQLRAQAFDIRSTAEGDLPAVQAIYAHHVLTGAASFELDPPDRDELRQRWSAIIAGGYPHLVAAEGGEILGYAYAGAYRPRPAYRYYFPLQIHFNLLRGDARPL